VGTHNHPLSNPLPLATLARLYPEQKIVMLHCWPYIEEAGYLAQGHPNVFIDTCWQPILNPEFLKQSLDNWLGYIPLNKITMSNDSTSVEMAAGASLITRRILTDAVERMQESSGISDHEYRQIVAKLLHNNAVAIYSKGNHFKV
jgi:predicted TIM-barrel fold metal-dependent hydrolase